MRRVHPGRTAPVRRWVLSYHVTNTLVHGLASGLLLLLLLRMGFAWAVALGGAAVFAVHPVLTEAVAWIPGRCDTLLAVFAFSAMLFFFRYLEGGGVRSLGASSITGVTSSTKRSATTRPRSSSIRASQFYTTTSG